jgi:protein TonB
VLQATIGVAEAGVDSDEIVVTRARRPIWARTPSARRLAALYPERARERGREGEASLQCVILAGGALDCARVSATQGFGAAALRVARRFRHAPTLADGSDAAGARVHLRVVFRMDDEMRGRG